MIGNYAISLFDSESLPLIKIILSESTKVDRVFILSSGNRMIEHELTTFSRQSGIKIEIVTIDDLNNFYEVYIMLEKICQENGFPSWVNMASGSGMALSALTLHAYFKDAPLVIFDKERGVVVKTDINRLKKIKVYQHRYFELISLISKHIQTNQELARHFNISVSAMSRRLKHLELLGIVSRRGSGRVNFPHVYQLTEFGKRLV